MTGNVSINDNKCFFKEKSSNCQYKLVKFETLLKTVFADAQAVIHISYRLVMLSWLSFRLTENTGSYLI